jgi:hypothetical protein
VTAGAALCGMSCAFLSVAPTTSAAALCSKDPLSALMWDYLLKFCNFLQLSVTVCHCLQLSATVCTRLQLSATVCSSHYPKCCTMLPRPFCQPGREWHLQQQPSGTRHGVHRTMQARRKVCAGFGPGCPAINADTLSVPGPTIN